ncbi:hypothetical protein KKF05_00945 [Patescibacteria group bacterium]|nr:hypothetical protein [Patescibacteria group bacterium]MBU1028793.1 hypothetical protein [Patescibacteria group bacterium]
MRIFVFGNSDFEPDSLPLSILPELRQKLPLVEFYCIDPNEDWPEISEVTIIDTIINSFEPLEFYSLDAFLDAPRLSMHDFDALTNLRLMQKIGRLKKIHILGLPPNIDKKQAVDWIVERVNSTIDGQENH